MRSVLKQAFVEAKMLEVDLISPVYLMLALLKHRGDSSVDLLEKQGVGYDIFKKELLIHLQSNKT